MTGLRMGLMGGAAGAAPGDPATFTTDFGEYGLGAAPADWSLFGGSANVFEIGSLSEAISGKVLRLRAASGQVGATWDDVPPAGDAEIRARICAVNITATGHLFGVMGLADPAALPEVSVAYGAVRRFGSSVHGNQLFASFEDLTIASAADTDFYLSSIWVDVRLLVDGADLKFRRWQTGTAEPETWDLEDTMDPASLGAGLVGILTTLTIYDMQCQFFSVGINGASPDEPE